MYKIVHAVEKVGRESFFFLFFNARTWSHPGKLNARRFETDKKKAPVSFATASDGHQLGLDLRGPDTFMGDKAINGPLS